jgi:hypothetical protein
MSENEQDTNALWQESADKRAELEQQGIVDANSQGGDTVVEDEVKTAIDQAKVDARDELAVRTAEALDLITVRATEALAKLSADAAESRDKVMAEAAEARDKVMAAAVAAREEPTGKVTNKDLWRLSAALNDRSSILERGQQSMLEHVDAGFDDLRANMLDLRGVVNEQLHKQDEHIDAVAQSITDLAKVVAPMRARWDIKNALLKGSWKLTAAMIGATSIVTGVVAHYGLYVWLWQWCR